MERRRLLTRPPDEPSPPAETTPWQRVLRALEEPRALYPSLLVAGLLLFAGGWIALGGAAGSEARDTYVEGVIGAPGRVNPLLAAGNAADEDLVALVFSGLTRITSDGTPVPDLAERWEVTPDGRTYTFHLRGAVFWHDGVRLTSADVAFTIGLLQDPEFPGPADLAAAWAPIEVLTPNELTVVLQLPQPSAPFLAQAALGVLPAHSFEGATGASIRDADFNRAPIGTGPYRIVELDRTVARLERNTSYHLGAPQIAHLELRFLGSEAALYEAINSGDVDGAVLDVCGRHRRQRPAPRPGARRGGVPRAVHEQPAPTPRRAGAAARARCFARSRSARGARGRRRDRRGADRSSVMGVHRTFRGRDRGP